MALVGYGAMVSACLTAADMLAQQGVSATVVDARFCKPLDAELLRQVPPGLFGPISLKQSRSCRHSLRVPTVFSGFQRTSCSGLHRAGLP